MTFEESYDRVNDLILQGLGIKESIKLAGSCDYTFYKNVTPQQRLQLHYNRTLNTMRGAGTGDLSMDPELRTFPIDKTYNYPEHLLNLDC
jgi:hypothetical protein